MSQTWIYNIPLPEGAEIDSFSDHFNWLEIEGLEENETNIAVYVHENNTEAFEAHLIRLTEELSISFTKYLMEEKNWNETWEKSFQPVKINQLAGIRASFHEPFEDVKFDIVIDPKMSFGTGHHATTMQVMEMMERIEILDKKILDLGSGTGILAILAEKMGAKEVLAIDNDPWCYENNLENNLLNNIQNVTPLLGSLEDVIQEQFDIVFANIQRNYLLENMGGLATVLKERGQLIISGFLPQDAQDLLNAALEHHLIAQYHTTFNNWDCILLEKHTL